jgi:hypothetical protein
MTFCARAKKKTGPTFFGERSVVGGGSLARRKKDRFARRCDDAFCWNAPNNKLSFLFFFFASSDFYWCFVGRRLANYFLDRRRLKREEKEVQSSKDPLMHKCTIK